MTADTVGGVWTYALELARGLQRHGGEVVLATIGAPLSADQWRAARQPPALEVYESIYKLEWMPEPWVDVDRAGDWLLEIEQQVQPDVVHLNGYSHGALPWQAPVVIAGHSCVLSWWQAVKHESAPADWQPYFERVQRGLQAARLVIAPTQAMLAALQRWYGPLPASTVIPNGRSEWLFPPGAKEPLILAAGRLWDEAKNIAQLQQVAPDLLWPVVVAGDQHPPDRAGPDLPAPGGQAVRWLGHLTETALAHWLGRASIYALPARYEPFGLSVLEAALAGCALVLGDIPSLRENWEGAALFVPPDDLSALRQGLEALIQSEPLCNDLAAAARARALTFTPERMTAGYLAAYVQARLPHLRSQAEPSAPAERAAVEVSAPYVP